MRTQEQIDIFLNQLQSAYNGTRPEYWGYPGECLSYVKRWIDTLRNGHVGGNMAAPASNNGYGTGYFNSPPAMISELFEKQAYNPNASYPAGSLFTYGKSGHIGILLNNQPGNPNALVTQSNADPDGSAVHQAQRSKSRIDGILVLRVAPPPPPAPVGPLFTIENIAPKQVRVQPGQRKWNLGHGSFNDVANNPITTSDADTVFTARAILRHREIPQYNYYLEDPNTPHGWNVLDCVDYTPPPPPYVPPAPPVKPVMAETATLVTKLMYFSNDRDAKDKQNYQGDLLPGKYYVFAKEGKAWNLSESNVHDRHQWVNMDDNIVDPPVVIPTVPVDVPEQNYEPVDPPAPVLPKYQFQMMQPVQLEAINAEAQVFPDLEGKTKILAQLNPGKVNEYSMRTIINGEEWLVPTVSMKKGYRHAIPRDLLDFPQMEGAYSPFDTDRDGSVEFSDFLEMVPKWYKTNVAPTIQKLAPKAAEAKQKLGKSIDGFRRPK